MRNLVGIAQILHVGAVCHLCNSLPSVIGQPSAIDGSNGPGSCSIRCIASRSWISMKCVSSEVQADVVLDRLPAFSRDEWAIAVSTVKLAQL